MLHVQYILMMQLRRTESSSAFIATWWWRVSPPPRTTSSLFMLSFLFKIRKTSLKFFFQEVLILCLFLMLFVLAFIFLCFSSSSSSASYTWYVNGNEWKSNPNVIMIRVLCAIRGMIMICIPTKPQGMMADGSLQRGKKLISLCQSRMRGNGSSSYS